MPVDLSIGVVAALALLYAASEWLTASRRGRDWILCANISKLSFTALAALLLAGCDDRPDQWDAYITYREDPERSEVIEGFKSYELCRAASLQRLETENAMEDGYFECGYKCGRKPGISLNVCKETRD